MTFAGLPHRPIRLAEIHLDLLYEQDGDGLLVRSRDPDQEAPLCHLVRTVEGNRWLLSTRLSPAQRQELVEALNSEPVIPDLDEVEAGPPLLSGAPALLAAAGAALKESRGPAFFFPDSLPTLPQMAEILQEPATATTVDELSWIRDVTPREQPLAVAHNARGEIVAVCHCARSTADAAEAGVETARDYRGRGFAGAVVTCWAGAVLASGRLPLYSTSWENRASRAVARKLALIMYAEDYSLG